MGVWKSLAGINTVEITTASTADALTVANNHGVTLFDVEYVDELRIRGKIYRLDQSVLQDCLERRGDCIKVIQRQGLYWSFYDLWHRPVLIVGLVLVLLMTLYLPTRIFFVRVEGNEMIPTKMIVEKAAVCGIEFGASRREVRSEKMKNALLSAIPELQWAGINTAGCVAVISVKERSVSEPDEKQLGISSIVAACDGIIKEMTVLQGNPLCAVGQAVKKGQVLVSAYTDCGLLIKVTASNAEIIGQTQHELQTVTPVEYMSRNEQITVDKQYRLRIGKNIINFCKDSGISDTTCVKMYEEKCLTLPGGLQLPVAIIIESQIYFDHLTEHSDEDRGYEWMTMASDGYLQNQMLAGEILESDRTQQLQAGVFILNSRYSCMEIIGVVRNEEIVKSDGKRD